MTSTLAAQLALPSLAIDLRQSTFDVSLAEFASFPYRRRPYSARNWGHPLHSLCSYPSKMKPAIAATLVRCFTRPGDVVLDPFAGVGTIPFEACAAGRNGVAVDLSPFAFCVAAGKVSPPRTDQADDYMNELAAYLRAAPAIDLSAEEPEIAEFYHQDTWHEVLLARQFFIERELDQPHPAHWFTKACVAHILHGNRPYALSRRSHGIIPIPPKGPALYKPLLRSLREKAARMGLAQLPPHFRPGEARQGSALSLHLGDGDVDAIFTSPPFLGTTEFIRQNRLRLWFCGMDYAAQLEAKAGAAFVENHKSLDIYSGVLQEFRRVLRPDGLAVIHLGVVKSVDMARGIAPIAVSQGFRDLATIYEDATDLESHGRTDRGATHQHQFLFLRGV